MSRGVPFLQQLEADLKTKTPGIKSNADALLLTLVQSAEKHGKDFSTATDKSLKDTETYLRTHKGSFTTLGKELLQGLEQGLAAEEPTLMGQAKRIAAEIEKTIRDALQTHSPSEVTAKIGEDLMAGLALGMQRSAPAAGRAGAGAALQVVGAISGSSPGVGAGGGMQTIVIELDGRTLTQYVQKNMHDNVKLLARFN